jgi:hypothetical protein
MATVLSIHYCRGKKMVKIGYGYQTVGGGRKKLQPK